MLIISKFLQVHRQFEGVTYLNVLAACLHSLCEGFDGQLDSLHAALLLKMLL